jgi:hypothetical protein
MDSQHPTNNFTDVQSAAQVQQPRTQLRSTSTEVQNAPQRHRLIRINAIHPGIRRVLFPEY